MRENNGLHPFYSRLLEHLRTLIERCPRRHEVVHKVDAEGRFAVIPSSPDASICEFFTEKTRYSA